MIKKTLLAITACTTFITAGGDIAPVETSSCGLYTDEYMMRSGVVYPCIDTGIPNRVSGSTLMTKKHMARVSVYFTEGKMTENSQEQLQTLLTKAQSSSYVSIIGHSSGFSDEDHSIKLSPWAEFWQNLGSSAMTSTATVNNRIRVVHEYLQKSNVPTGDIYNENRMDRDLLATEATSVGKALNNRVDVTLYY